MSKHHAEMSVLMSEEDWTIADKITKLLSAHDTKSRERKLAMLKDKGWKASEGSCGCFYGYGGYCGGEERIEVMLPDKVLVFWGEDDYSLEGVEMCEDDAKTMQTISDILANYQATPHGKDVAFKLARLTECGLPVRTVSHEDARVVFEVTLPNCGAVLPLSDAGVYIAL